MYTGRASFNSSSLLGIQDAMAPLILQDLIGLDQREKKSKPEIRFAFLLSCVSFSFLSSFAFQHICQPVVRGAND